MWSFIHGKHPVEGNEYQVLYSPGWMGGNSLSDTHTLDCKLNALQGHTLKRLLPAVPVSLACPVTSPGSLLHWALAGGRGPAGDGGNGPVEV
jgi:hypothetical protein